ncbi:MAG: PAS domain S-box protein [Elusimicrobia bacterium]|nr:PAS domain S-box protein [Elusimicrobiota bacterium]
MIPPPLPPNESRRIAILRSLGILDTPPEERFDRITRITMRIFSVPVALVTLVDSQRQWFKSHPGIEIQETPRELSFCAYTILGDDVLVVPDLSRDPRFCDNPILATTGTRFYAACPISATDGSKLGTLCILDRQPRELSAEECQLLCDLASLVEEEINIHDLKDAFARLKESETSLKDFFENASDMIAFVSPDGHLMEMNQAWLHSLGLNDSRAASMSLLDAVDPADRDRIAEVHKRTLAGQTVFNFEATLIDAAGRQIAVEGNMNCRFRNRKPGYSRLILRNITERKKVQALKDGLIAIAAHELRSPLASIYGSLQMLKEDAAQGEKSRQWIDMSWRNTSRMMRLIDDYLDLEKIEAGQVNFDLKPLELVPFLEQVLEANRGLAQTAKLRLTLDYQDAAAKVLADRDRLTQVVTNLLSNACKFSPAGEEVSVRVIRVAKGIRVSVQDHGPGVSKEFRSQIFNKYAQAASPQGPKKGSSGLGLNISKAIIEKLGGGIGLENLEGQGSIFFFELPELKDTVS